LVTSADLILTAQSAHRSRILQVEPALFRRTFTMREFGRLGAAAQAAPVSPDAAALRARVSEIAGLRGQVGPAEAGADEVGDPYGASLDFARLIGAQISAAVDSAIAVLGLPA
jgi:protein-tyrosine-phosphatase